METKETTTQNSQGLGDTIAKIIDTIMNDGEFEFL